MELRQGDPSRPADGDEDTGPLARYTYLPSIDAPGFVDALSALATGKIDAS